MKTLELRCACGARKTFTGRNADEVIVDIDAAGWTDLPGGGRGWAPGVCDGCALATSLDSEE